MDRDWSAVRREISGFGGGYEEACRKMVEGGLVWLDEHPEADPKFHGFKDVYGICAEDNADAKALTEAIIEPVKGEGVTGAMHQAAVTHCLFIRKHGWDEYVRQMQDEGGE